MSSFAVGDVVWLKLRGFPQWPARVCAPGEGGSEVRSQRKPGAVLVKSYGDHMFVWTAPKELSGFSASAGNDVLGKASGMRLKQAITEALAVLKRPVEPKPKRKAEAADSPEPKRRAGAGNSAEPQRHADAASSERIFTQDEEQHIEHLVLLQQNASNLCEAIDHMLQARRLARP